MSLLERLPRELFNLLLSYLTFSEIVNFDYAVLNRCLRSLYLNSLNGLQIFSKSLFLDWHDQRDILIPSITFFGFDSLTKNYVSKFRHRLKSIILESSSGGFLIRNIHLQELGHCASLRSIHISKCHKINDKYFEKFLKLNSQLVEVDLLDCETLTPLSLLALNKYCPNLESLCLSDNIWVDDEAIDLLTKIESSERGSREKGGTGSRERRGTESRERGGCKRLKVIACHNTSITGRAIEKMLDSFPHLEAIEFLFDSDAVNVTTTVRVLEQVVWRSLQRTETEIIQQALRNLYYCLG
jgi:hypothetical protein